MRRGEFVYARASSILPNHPVIHTILTPVGFFLSPLFHPIFLAVSQTLLLSGQVGQVCNRIVLKHVIFRKLVRIVLVARDRRPGCVSQSELGSPAQEVHYATEFFFLEPTKRSAVARTSGI